MAFFVVKKAEINITMQQCHDQCLRITTYCISYHNITCVYIYIYTHKLINMSIPITITKKSSPKSLNNLHLLSRHGFVENLFDTTGFIPRNEKITRRWKTAQRLTAKTWGFPGIVTVKQVKLYSWCIRCNASNRFTSHCKYSDAYDYMSCIYNHTPYY